MTSIPPRLPPAPVRPLLRTAALNVTVVIALLLVGSGTDRLVAQQPDAGPAPTEPDATVDPQAPAGAEAMDMKELLRAGGMIGLIIMGLSIAMLALIIEHLISIRRRALMPDGLAEIVQGLLASGRITEARKRCRQEDSFLGRVLDEGLAEIPMGYPAVEKVMEDTSGVQAGRLLRKIEYLSVIGTIAPMLGLLGTVWGMILAFQSFATEVNPQVSQLAPGIYKALVTTLLGLGVAVPALTAFALFRNRIDELVAEASLAAEQVFADFKRSQGGRKAESGRRPRTATARVAPVTATREPVDPRETDG